MRARMNPWAGFASCAAMAAALTTAAVAAAQTATPNPQGWAFVTFILKDDAQSYVDGKDTVFERPSLPKVETTINAAKLAAEFHSNTFRAEEFYRDRTIAITGPAMRVARGMGGTAYVAYGPFLPGGAISAYLAADAMGDAADIDVSQPVQLVCVGAEQRMALPRLNECRTMRSVTAVINRAVDVFMEELLAGKGATAEDNRKILLWYYLWAATAKPDNPCLRRFVPSCGQQIRAWKAKPAHRQTVLHAFEIFRVPLPSTGKP